MNPKEKAIQITNNYMFLTNNDKELSKKCAITSVVEIINNKPFGTVDTYYELVTDRIEDCIEFWKEVKDIILTL